MSRHDASLRAFELWLRRGGDPLDETRAERRAEIASRPGLTGLEAHYAIRGSVWLDEQLSDAYHARCVAELGSVALDDLAIHARGLLVS